MQSSQWLHSHAAPPFPPCPMLRFIFFVPGHEHYQGSSQHWRGGKRGGGTSILITIYGRRVVFFHSFCIFPGGNVKGGKQPEDLFSHFDFNFRLQSSCWREGAVSGLPHVVVLLSHCFARTYVGIWLYMYMSRYIYICICGQLGSVCLLRTLKFASSSGCTCFLQGFVFVWWKHKEKPSTAHRPLIDRSSTAHRPL